MTGKLEAIRPKHFPWFDYSRYTFSLGLTRGEGAWLSGHSASEYDPAEGHIVVKGDLGVQCRTAYAKIAAILDAAGRDLGDVHRVVEYITTGAIEGYAQAEEARAEVFAAHRPAVSTVVVERLLRSQALIEIEVTAGPPGRPIVVDTKNAALPNNGAAPPGYAPAFEGGDIIYLSSLTAVRPQGEVVGEGDLVAQTEYVFGRAASILAAAGLGLSSTVKTVDYTTPATISEYRRTGKVRKEMLGPVYPAAAGILVSRLQHRGALISLDLIASRGQIESVNPGWERYEKLTYSPAVRTGNILFMSGQAALDPETEQAVFPADVAVQAEYTYGNVLRVLEAAGGGPQHLVKTIEYVTPAGLDRYREVARVRERFLAEPYPASTGVVCESLLRPEFEFEVDPFAVLD